MSAAGRSARLDPTGLDFYETPAWAVRAFASVWQPDDTGFLFDPCCGRGSIMRAWPDQSRSWWGCEVDEARAAEAEALPNVSFVARGSCMELSERRVLDCDYGAVISNVPYNAAPEILRWALTRLPRGTLIALLMRLPFLCAKEGREFVADHVPDVYVLSDRPSFSANGKSDSADYAWMQWEAGRKHKRGTVTIIPKGAGK